MYTQTITVVDTTAPTFTCPANIPPVNADAGGCTAVVSITTPTATDNCDATATVVGVRSDAQPLNAPFPTGVTTITWTATDSCGNSNIVPCVQTVTVNAVNELLLDVELGGGVMAAGPYTRCITVQLWNGSFSSEVSTDIEFNSGVMAAPVTVLVPCGSTAYTCITARDKKHTLRETITAGGPSLPTSGTKYAVNFTGGSKLIGGNLNDDRFIDILDFGIFTTQDLTAPGADTACGYVGRHADVDGDGAVGSVDFGYITNNFLSVRDLNCNGASLMAPGGQGDGPVTRISVADLQQQGMADLIRADLNKDGWLDQADVSAYMNGVRPGEGPTGPRPPSRPIGERPGLRPTGPVSPLE